MIFTEKIVVGKISVKVMHSGKIMPWLYMCMCKKIMVFCPKNLLGSYLQDGITASLFEKRRLQLGIKINVGANANFVGGCISTIFSQHALWEKSLKVFWKTDGIWTFVNRNCTFQCWKIRGKCAILIGNSQKKFR